MNAVGVAVTGLEYGIGHSKRIGYLLAHAKERGWDVFQIDLSGSQDPRLEFKVHGSRIKSADVLVIDLDPRYILDNTLSINQTIKGLVSDFCKVVMFDSGQNFPIRAMLSELSCDLLVYPYGGIELRKDDRLITGFGATIFPKALKVLHNRPINSTLIRKNVLISCGGSDPHNVTSTFIKALSEVTDIKLNVTVILGPLFPDEYLREVKSLAKKSIHGFDFAHSPDSMEGILAASDIGLVTGGITRSELVYCGIPSVVIDIDQNQQESTILFEKSAAVFRAGTIGVDSEFELISSVSRIIKEIIGNGSLAERLTSSSSVLFQTDAADFILGEIESYVKKRQWN